MTPSYATPLVVGRDDVETSVGAGRRTENDENDVFVDDNDNTTTDSTGGGGAVTSDNDNTTSVDGGNTVTVE